MHPGVNLLPGANLHAGANCAHEHGLCSENKGADQLRGYRSASLFLHMQNVGFLMMRLIILQVLLAVKEGEIYNRLLIAHLVTYSNNKAPKKLCSTVSSMLSGLET